MNTVRKPAAGVSAPFHEGVARRRLMLQFDPASGRAQFYPRPQGPSGQAAVEWREASGRGSVLALTIARVAPAQLQAAVPYLLALVRLDEGPRVLARIAAPVGSVRAGNPVEVDWDATEAAPASAEAPAFPLFRPAA